MPGRLSFSRLRPRLSNFPRRDHGGGKSTAQKTPAASSSLKVTKADLDNAARTKPQLPDRASLTQLRQALKAIADVLDQVDDTVLDILDGADDEGPDDETESSGSSASSSNPLVVSIGLHLADLQRSSSALCKLVTKYRPENRQLDTRPARNVDHPAEGESCPRASDDQSSPTSLSSAPVITPDQQACGCLPGPEFSLFTCSSPSLVADNSSAYSPDFSEHHADSSPSSLQSRRQRHSSAPATTSVASVAPLKLSARGSSTRSTASLRLQAEHQHRRAFSSPFDYEIGYLDGQIGESPGMGRKYCETLTHVSEGPVQRRLLSDSRCGLEPIGEVEAVHLDARPRSLEIRRYGSRRSSTEEKTWRLQSRRRGSAPSGGAGTESEPMQIEDLIRFLREGNSIREL